MTQHLTYRKPHKLSLLHDQLLAAGITPEYVGGTGDDITIDVQDAVAKAAVDAVVNAHDPAVITTGEQDEAEHETARDDLRAQYQTMLTRLDDIAANGSGYTAAQVRDAMVDLARIQRRVLRLLRHVA